MYLSHEHKTTSASGGAERAHELEASQVKSSQVKVGRSFNEGKSCLNMAGCPPSTELALLNMADLAGVETPFKLSLAVLAGGCCREPSSHLHLLLEQVSE